MSKSLLVSLLVLSFPVQAGVLARDAPTNRYVLVENGALQLLQEAKGANKTPPLASVQVPAETPELKYTKYCGFEDTSQEPNEVFIGLAQKADPKIDDVVPYRVWVVRFSPPAIEEENAVDGFLCDNPWASAY